MFKKLNKNQSGDTIIEVLIALAILVAVLTGAYYTASQSFRADRDAQEHTIALTIAQSQVEALRAAGLSGEVLPSTGQCISANLQPSTNCQVASNSTSVIGSCTTSSPYCYTVKFTKLTRINSFDGLSGVNLQGYEVDVTWQPLGGTTGSTDDVTLYYRWDT